MYYIVLDLEWNQGPKNSKNTIQGMPFEIIEIGAIKLNENKEIIDTFSETIKPVVYKEMHHIIKEITSLTSKDFRTSRSFDQVFNDFSKWCTDDCVFCTWGSTDLTELQRNMNYHNIPLFKYPVFYYDIQKIFSIVFEDRKTKRSLEYAIDFFQIEKNMNFHRALSDAYYTSKIMKFITDPDHIIDNFSVDTYQVPKTINDEIYINFPSYSKYISRLFDSKTDALADPKVSATICCKCGKKARKKIKWFSSNAKIYYSLSQCSEHGFLKSKLRMKKHETGKYFVVKTTKVTNKEGIERLLKRQNDLREKRRLKRAR